MINAMDVESALRNVLLMSMKCKMESLLPQRLMNALNAAYVLMHARMVPLNTVLAKIPKFITAVASDDAYPSKASIILPFDFAHRPVFINDK